MKKLMLLLVCLILAAFIGTSAFADVAPKYPDNIVIEPEPQEPQPFGPKPGGGDGTFVVGTDSSDVVFKRDNDKTKKLIWEIIWDIFF